jgi:hypothetical protein
MVASPGRTRAAYDRSPMTRTAAAFTDHLDSTDAGLHLAEQIAAGLGGERPDAVVVFAAARHDHGALLRALAGACDPGVMVGASSAGEFTGDRRGEGSACALAIRSAHMRFAAGIGTGVGASAEAAAAQIVDGFAGPRGGDFPYRAALVLTDALAGHCDELFDQLTIATSGGYQFAGGGAGDDALFQRTHVFHGTTVATDAAVALEVLSTRPLGIGVQHGWSPAGDALRVTEVDGARLISLDGFPAVEAFEQHAARTGQTLDRAAPLPFLLHNVLGIDTPDGHRLRVPLAIGEDGSILCAAAIPAGARLHIMRTSSTSACEAATEASRRAVQALGGARPAAALFFDCVATRLRMGDVFGSELEAARTALGGLDLVGCNTYGQIARADGQFSGFHNCTAVVFAFPD